MLHGTKSQAIVQWFNSLTHESIQFIAQFSDGSHFYDIATSFNSPIQVEVASVAEEGGETTEVEPGVTSSNEIFLSESGLEIDSCDKDPENVSVKTRHVLDIQDKYEVIGKFIDDFFKINSKSMIDYLECMNGKELELAKVAVMLLSAMVQKLLANDDPALNTTTLLDPDIQEDIKECVSFVLEPQLDVGTAPFKKELQKILSRAAKCKGTPRRTHHRNYTELAVETPESVRPLAKKRSGRAASSTIYDEISESPLKRLLDSPSIQQKTALYRRDVEIAKLRSSLIIEENRVSDFMLEKNNLKIEVEKKTREIEKLKSEHKKWQETYDEIDAQKQLEITQYKNEFEKHKQIQLNHGEEMKLLEDVNKELRNQISGFEEKISKLPTPAVDAEGWARSLDAIKNLKEDLKIKDNDIIKYQDQLETLTEKATTYKDLYDSLVANQKDSPKSSPKVSETLSNIVSADQSSRESEEKLQCTEKKCADLELLLMEEHRRYDNLKEELREKDKKCADLDKQLVDMKTSDQAQEILKCKEKVCDLEKLLMVEKQKCSEFENLYLPADKKQNAYKKKVSELNSLKASNQLQNQAEQNKSVTRSQRKKNSVDQSLSIDVPHATSDDEMANKEIPDEEDFQEGQIWRNYDVETKRSRSGAASCAPSKSPLSSVAADNIVNCGFELPRIKQLARKLVKTIESSFPKTTPSVKNLENLIKTVNTVSFVELFFTQLLQNLQAPHMRNVTEISIKRGIGRPRLHEDVDQTAISLNKVKKLEAKLKAGEEQLLQKDNKIADLWSRVKDFQKLKLLEAEVRHNAELWQTEAADAKKKYESAKRYIEKMHLENKKLKKMYITYKQVAVSKDVDAESCRNCKKFHCELLQAKKDKNDNEQEKNEMIAIIKDLQCKLRNLDRQVKEQGMEKKRLEFRLQQKQAFLSGNASEQNKFVQHYFNEGLAENAKKAKTLSLSEKETHSGKPTQILNFNAYLLPEMKESFLENSLSLDNRSVISGFCQIDDEEDFRNQSSVAEILGGIPDPDNNSEDRLNEIRHRNTLCLPHLQSSYPLEVQNMTPSEKKYYDQRETAHHRASEAERKAYSVVDKKRKASEMDASSSTSAKRFFRGASRNGRCAVGKLITPARQAGKFKPFRTPSSISRLMKMSHKNKEQ